MIFFILKLGLYIQTLYIFCILDSKFDKINWAKNTIELKKSSVVSIKRYFWAYILCCEAHFMVLTAPKIDEKILVSLFSLSIFWLFLSRTILQTKALALYILCLNVNTKNEKNFLILILNIWYAIYISMTIVNYSLYIILPEQYVVADNVTYCDLPFEFLYYTLTVMLTFSANNSISVVGLLAKTLQIMELIISCFIIVSAINPALINTINSRKDKLETWATIENHKSKNNISRK